MNTFGNATNELIKQDKKNAAQLKKRLYAELKRQENDLSLDDYNQLKKEIDEEIEEAENDTKNQVKEETYLRAEFV